MILGLFYPILTLSIAHSPYLPESRNAQAAFTLLYQPHYLLCFSHTPLFVGG